MKEHADDIVFFYHLLIFHRLPRACGAEWMCAH